MVLFSPLQCCASRAGWMQSGKSRAGKLFSFLFFFSLIKKSTFGCTVHLPPRHELLNFLFQKNVHFSISAPSNVEDAWSSVFLTLPQIFCLETSPPQSKTTKKKNQFQVLSSINALISLGILTYIASHGLASSYLGDLLGFLELLLHFELCSRQSPVVLSRVGYVHWGWLLASLQPSSDELLHPTHICWHNHRVSIKTTSQMVSFHFSWLFISPHTIPLQHKQCDFCF